MTSYANISGGTFTEATAHDLVRLNLDEEDFEQFLISVDQSEKEVARLNEFGDVKSNHQMTKERVNENLHPLHESITQIEAYTQELQTSLTKIDDLSSSLKFQNKQHLFKLEKLQSREEELQQKKTLLEQLHGRAHIDPDLIRHLLHGDVIDEKFFKAFQAVQSLKSLHDQLAEVEIEGEEYGLRSSLLKNFNEIRSVGMSKIIQSLNSSVQKSSEYQLKLFRESLEESEEGTQKFLETLFRHRKNIIKEKLMPLKNKINYSMTSKMNIFLNELFLSFFEIIRTEKAFMKEVFDEGQSQRQALQVVDELFAEILLRVERSLIIEKDFFEMFKIRECLERNKIKFMNAMNITEQEVKDKASQNEVSQKSPKPSDNRSQGDSKIGSISLVNKLIVSSNELIKHNLVNESDVLLATKFNIQRIAAYQCIVDLVEKISSVFSTIFESPLIYKDLSILQFLRPLETLIESKLMKRTAATCIFSSNIQTYLLSELSKFIDNSKELAQRLKEYETQVEEHLQYLCLTNIQELLKLGKVENFEVNVQERINKKDQDDQLRIHTVNAKRAFVFLLNLQSTISKKILFRDVFLIQDEEQRKLLQGKIIAEICTKYDVIYNELNEFVSKTKKPTEEINLNAQRLATQFGLDLINYLESSKDMDKVSILSSLQYAEMLRIHNQ